MTYNELVEKARELGVAIQDTDEFTAFIVAKTAADKSEKLQDKLGQFNLKKLDLNRAIIAEEKDNEKIAELNGEVKNLYEAIVSDPLMIAYSTTKDELFYPQLGVKLCSMAGGGVQKIYMVFLREPSRRDRSGSDLFHLRDGFEIKMNFDRNVSCFIFVNALMHDDFFD